MYSIEKLQPVNTYSTPLRMKALHAPQWHSATKDKHLYFFIKRFIYQTRDKLNQLVPIQKSCSQIANTFVYN